MWQQLWLELKAPFAGQNWWAILNSGIVTTLLSSLVGIYLAQRVNKVAQTAQAQQDAARDSESAEVDDKPLPTPTPANGVNRQEIRESFQAASVYIERLKAYVDAKAERVRDGRTRRKYENVRRNDYRVLIGVIEKDGGWKGLNKQHDELFDIFEKWRPYARGGALVPADFMETLKAAAKRYNVTPGKPAGWHPAKRVAED